VDLCTGGSAMDWDDIRVFLELARLGSLSATAKPC
jgi:DNA-binding transcriptional LysR family regulator